MIEKDISYEDRKNFRGGGMDMGSTGSSKGSSGPAGGASSGGNYGGNTGGGRDMGANTSGGNGGNDRQPTGDDYRRAAREFQMGVQGAARNPIVGDTGPNLPFQNFQLTRPQVPNIPLGIGGILMNMIPGSTSPLQRFSDFTTAKNRDYFINEVVRAGRIPGLNYGTISEMTEPELEQAYQSYLSNRLSGKTDAYGNPIQKNDDDNNDPLQNILLAQQLEDSENLQGGVGQLYNKYMRNLGYTI
jgi:hypothetical protein